MKKIVLVISILAFILIFGACSDSKSIHTSEAAEEAQEDADSWKHSYREILEHVEDHLADQYNLRNTWNQFMYLAIHDFNYDNVPEFIIGDNVSIAVFSYEDGEAVKIADLYEPEEWGGINGLYYCDNTLILRSDGSDGSGYVCFTFCEGKYVTGICDDYNPESGIINKTNVSRTEFNQWFNLSKLLENSTKINSVQIEINDDFFDVELGEGDTIEKNK